MRGIALIGVSLSATVLLWVLSVTSGQGVLISFRGAAQILGILGFMGISWASLLSIRHAVLEELFGGLDKTYRIHHLLGGSAFILIINHPLLLIIDSLPSNTLKTYLLPGPTISYTLGVLALYVLLILLILTLFINLPYKLWKLTHEWMGVVILLAGLHAYLVPSALANFLPLKIWIISWGVAALAGYIYKRFGYYRLSAGANYRVEQITREGETVIARLVHDGVGRPLNFVPGQFAFFALPDKPRDEHPFSILSQVRERIAIGFKLSGQFTHKAGELKEGAIVKVHGPFGTFGQILESAKEMVWVAGGIGITPFATMAMGIRPDQRVTFFYTSRVEGPVILTRAFGRFAQMTPNFQMVEHITEKAGHLTAQVIQNTVQLTSKTYVLLCGPKPMMEELTEQLVSIGIKRKRIIYEDFSLK